MGFCKILESPFCFSLGFLNAGSELNSGFWEGIRGAVRGPWAGQEVGLALQHLPARGALSAGSWRVWESFVVFDCLSCSTSGAGWSLGFLVVSLFILLLVGLLWGFYGRSFCYYYF